MEKVQDKLMQQFQNMDKAYESYAKSKGMTYLALVVLEEIYEIGESCTQKQISDDTHYPKQSINLVIKSFLDDGYVELKELPSNRRNKQIVLTKSGRQLCEEIIVPLLEMENHAMTAMGETQSAELIRLLELYGNLYCSGMDKIMQDS